MCGFSALFPTWLMLFLWDYRLIGAPEISIADTAAIYLWKSIPEFLARRFAAITTHKRNNLACFATKRKPNPALICFCAYKGPKLIQFKREATGITRNCRNKCLCE